MFSKVVHFGKTSNSQYKPLEKVSRIPALWVAQGFGITANTQIFARVSVCGLIGDDKISISCGDPVSSKQSIRYLALGDSYTIGESVAENECWPNQLAELIKSSPPFGGIEEGVEVTLIAYTGWTTEGLWQGIQAAKPELSYDLVSLLIGVNYL
jgi:hypothetical protein